MKFLKHAAKAVILIRSVCGRSDSGASSGKYQPGIVFTLGQSFFDDHIDKLFESLVDSINAKSQTADGDSWKFPTQLQDKQGQTLADVQLSGFKFIEAEDLKSANKSLKLKEDCGPVKATDNEKMGGGIDPDIVLQFGCLQGRIEKVPTLGFQFNFDIQTRAEGAQGTASVWLHDLSVMYQVRPYSEMHSNRFSSGEEETDEHPGGRFALDFDYLLFDCRDFYLDLESSQYSDRLRGAFDHILDSYFGTGHSSVNGLSSGQLDQVNDLVNQVIAYSPHTRLYGDTVEVDYQLVGEGVQLTDDFISVLLDGTFHSVDDQTEPATHKAAHPLPYYKNEKDPVQIYVSDYTTNSFIKAVQNIGWLDGDHMISGDKVNSIVKDFNKAYGQFKEVRVNVEALPNSKSIKKSGRRGSLDLSMAFDINVRNPFHDGDMNAATIRIKLSFTIEPKIQADYGITGKTSNTKLQVLDFTPYFGTPTTKGSLISQSKLVEVIAAEYLEAMASKGFKSPLPEWLTSTARSPYIQAFAGYFLIDADGQTLE